MVLSVCVGLLVFLTAVAAADNGSAPLVQATVYKAGGGTMTDSVSQAQLQAAPQCPVYAGRSMDEYGRQGEVTVSPSPTNSWTVGTILGCLQTPVSLADVTGITIIGSDGSPEVGPGSELTPADLASSSDFQTTSQNPVVQDLGSTDQYDRPWRGGSDLDFLDEAQSSPIAMEVFEGPPLSVTASASQTTLTAGGTVSFSAAVSGNDGSSLSYSWNFDGGAPTSTQPAPQVTFNTAGVWTVNVEVTDGNGGGGGDQLTVTVNPAGASTTPTTSGTQTTGPNNSNGTTPGGTPGSRRHGTTTSGAKGHSGQSTDTNSRSSGKHKQKRHKPQTTHTPAGNAGSGTGTGSSGAGSSGTGSSGAGSSGSPQSSPPAAPTTPVTPAPKTTPSSAPTHRSSPATEPASPRPLVTGRLISDVVPLPAGQSPLVHVVTALSPTAPARQSPRRPSALPILGAGGAVRLLLGLGAGRELRAPRRRRVLPTGA